MENWEVIDNDNGSAPPDNEGDTSAQVDAMDIAVDIVEVEEKGETSEKGKEKREKTLHGNEKNSEKDECTIADDTNTPQKILDLVFMIDCTASMQPYINSAKGNAKAIITRMSQEDNYDIKFGLVTYRDHPPQDHTYITKSMNFTDDIDKIQRVLNSLKAKGGGDGPEAVTTALSEVEKLSWRVESTKFIVLIADAPPHGLNEYGDGFPDGSPDGLDPIIICRSMAQKGMVIYCVGCEPALGNYKYARTFFAGIASITNGKAVTLDSAALLPNVILGGAMEETELELLGSQLEKEMNIIREDIEKKSERKASNDEVSAQLYSNMQQQKTKMRTTTMFTDGEVKDEYADLILESPSLNEVRKNLTEKHPGETRRPKELSISSGLPLGGARYDRGSACAPTEASFADCKETWRVKGDVFSAPASRTATNCSFGMSTVTPEQCMRMVSKRKVQGKW